MPRAFMRLGLRIAFRNAALPFGVRRNSSSQRQQITESPRLVQDSKNLFMAAHWMLPGTLQVPECMQFWHVLGCSTLNEFFATCSRKAVSNASWEASTACQCIQPHGQNRAEVVTVPFTFALDMICPLALYFPARYSGSLRRISGRRLLTSSATASPNRSFMLR